MKMCAKRFLPLVLLVIPGLFLVACTMPSSPATTRPRPEPGNPETLRSFIDGVPTNPPDPESK